jgi:Holliday junction resolvase
MQHVANRGREFENKIAELLRVSGFRVTSNAGAARPRQTDLYAQGDGVDLLVEVKDRQRKVNVGDVDSLRSRLDRTAADVVGAIFTTSEVTKGVIKAIEVDRTREVLVFVREEIEHLFSAPYELRELIDRKREELRVQGKVWISPVSSLEFVGVKLPVGKVEFRIEHTTASYFASKVQDNPSACYALQIPDSGWGIAGGEGSLLRMRLALTTIQDLRNILGYLHEKFGLSNNGMFSIHQSSACWHGVGAEDFVQAVVTWHERYKRSRANAIHHSESLYYFDQFRSGWVVLSSHHRVGWKQGGLPRDPFLYGSELAIQLPGTPVDAAPFLNLCQYTGNVWAHFEHVGQRLTHSRRLKKSIALDVVGKAVNTAERERVVVGIIVRNPFYRKRLIPKELQCDEMTGLQQELVATELLLCYVRDWHDDRDVIDRYMLQGFETSWAHRAHVIRPFGTWNRIVKSARAQWDSELDVRSDDL